MTRAIHLINKRDENNRLKGLSRDPNRPHTHRSSCWIISDEDAAELVGGWVYLHPTKAELSEFGGLILNVIPTKRIGNEIEDGYEIVFESRREARNKKWRGRCYKMSWTSRVIEASYSHEL
ncbi:hypothetical protein [Microvirga sp. G4-2]|uniref:hypothetical protein n=1 Tax=Microvirga sp. G4-2 TaxID=3434467 RepID=UPI0040450DEE